MIRHLAISDLHICSERDGQAWSTIDLDLLLAFLRWADGPGHVVPVKVIVTGDAFEGLYDPDLDGMWRLPVFQQIIGMVQSRKLFLVRGNHDERMARAWPALYATESLDLLLDGIRYTHGHKWDWRCLPDEPLDNIGARLMWLWSKIIRRKPDLGPFRSIVSDEKQTIRFNDKASKYAAGRKEFVVCGHTHSATIDHGPDWVYCNTGSWQGGRCDVLAVTIMPLDGKPTPVSPLLTDAVTLMKNGGK
jgi:UDP-2,3-diacylglucosamine pyrophosphatase LpxH